MCCPSVTATQKAEVHSAMVTNGPAFPLIVPWGETTGSLEAVAYPSTVHSAPPLHIEGVELATGLTAWLAVFD